jgi:hypothetical protein
MRSWRLQRRLASLGAAALLLGGLVVALPAVAPGAPVSVHEAAAISTAGPTAAGGIVPCPTGDPANETCAQMPCPTLTNCGLVEVGPTQNLAVNQYVYVKFSGFTPGDEGTSVFYCSDPGGTGQLNAPGTSPPQCGNNDTGTYNENTQFVPMFPSGSSAALPAGTAGTSIEAGYDAAPAQPISGSYYTYPTVTSGPGFYCDGTAANACEIVITDVTINNSIVTSSANSVAIPITFAPSSNGCSGATVPSESEFGIELLMPLVARLACAQDPGAAAIPQDVAVDGLGAVTDLVQQSFPIQLAYTDDPEASDQKAQLANGSYALIPVALTANVVGFYGDLHSLPNTYDYPLTTMDLTPTMVAGLTTAYGGYPGASQTDDMDGCTGPSAVSKGVCASPPCFSTQACSLFMQQNFASGFLAFGQHWSYVRADSAGSTDQLFNWLCNAPIVPLSYGPHPVSETQSAGVVLKASLGGDGPPLSTCPSGVDQMPPVPGAPVNLLPEGTPGLQALKAYANANTSSFQSPAAAAFAPMNWGEASFYGMSVAALQNAAGQFVTPSATSLDAAVQDATKNPDGSISPSYTNTGDTAAYPMPDVIYAVVPTTPVPQAQATAETELLNQLLDLTGTGGSNVTQLPQGFVPLPSSLVSQAQDDIKSDVKAAPSTLGSPPGSGGNGTSPGSTPSSNPNSSSASNLGSSFFGPNGLLGGLGAFGGLPALGGFTPLAELALKAGAAAAGPGARGLTGALLGPNLAPYALVASHGSTLMSLALVGGLIGMVAGVILLSSGAVSRRRLRAAAADAGVAEAEVEVGPE